MNLVQKKSKDKLTRVLTLLTFLLFPVILSANTVEIYNSINASANTGGNSTKPDDPSADGQTGRSSAEVRVQTRVNGQEIESIEKTVNTTGSAEATIDQEVIVDDQESEIFKDQQDKSAKTKQDLEEENHGSVFSRIIDFFGQIQSFFTGLFK